MRRGLIGILFVSALCFMLTACGGRSGEGTGNSFSSINTSNTQSGSSSFQESNRVSSSDTSSHMDSSKRSSSNGTKTNNKIELNLKADDIIKIEYKGVPQLNIPAQQFTKADDINSIVSVFNDMEITDDCTVNYDEMNGLNNAMVFYYANGKKMEIWHMKSGGLGEGGLNIRDNNSKYGMRWLTVKNAGEYLD